MAKIVKTLGYLHVTKEKTYNGGFVMEASSKVPKVTFDSNVLCRVLLPDEVQIPGAPSVIDQQIVNKALKDRRIEGFVAKTFFTKEAISNRCREIILRRTFMRYKDLPFPKDKKPRKEIDATRRTTLALMRQYHVRILHTYLFGDVPLDPELKEGDFRLDNIQIEDFYRWNGNENEVMIRNDECFRYIHDALKAGVLSVDSLDARDGCLVGDAADLALMYKNPSAEESDMQAISTHYAHQIDIFCTEDKGKGAGGNSVMKPVNKDALTKKFGIRFCTLSELAKLVANEDVVCH